MLLCVCAVSFCLTCTRIYTCHWPLGSPPPPHPHPTKEVHVLKRFWYSFCNVGGEWLFFNFQMPIDLLSVRQLTHVASVLLFPIRVFPRSDLFTSRYYKSVMQLSLLHLVFKARYLEKGLSEPILSVAVTGWTFIDVLVGSNAMAFFFLTTPSVCRFRILKVDHRNENEEKNKQQQT